MTDDEASSELALALAISMESFRFEEMVRDRKASLEPTIETCEVFSTPPTSPQEPAIPTKRLLSTTLQTSPPLYPSPMLLGQVLPSPRVNTPEPFYRVQSEEFPLLGHIPGQPEAHIAIMGPAGSGKTTLLNMIAGRELGKVGEGLHYGTGEVTSYDFAYAGINFTVCDTPGFDDATHTDTEILRKISDWLVQSYRQQRRLNAILYLSRISDPRMQGSPLRNLMMFKELCGADCFQNIVLGTTFWGQTDALHPGIAEQREQELINDFWDSMITKGSEVVRVPEERWLARELLVRLATKGEITLQTQRERVDQSRGFETTAAHRALNEEHERLEAKFEADMKQKKETLEKEFQERQERQAKEEAKRTADLNKKLAEQRKEHKKLEEQHKKQAAESKRLWEEATRERERLEAHSKELVEEAKKMARDHKLQVRRRRQAESDADIKNSIAELERAAKASRIKARLREIQGAYMAYCDNCFKSIGVGTYYKFHEPGVLPSVSTDHEAEYSIVCHSCTSVEGGLVLCQACHRTNGVYCDDSSHFSAMEKKIQSDTQCGCRRVSSPPLPGARLPCDGCGNNVGAVYFHCCSCSSDNFDLCLVCVTTGKTCGNANHGLDCCVRQTRPWG